MSLDMTIVQDFPQDFEAADDDSYRQLGTALGDRRDGRIYVSTKEIRMAVRVALASGRPLLLRGPAGSGKSSLAPFVARVLKRRYYWATVTARTEARDLMWRFDALKRLNDAQLQTEQARARVEQVQSYIEPGALWWAFDPISAERRGLKAPFILHTDPALDPGIGERVNGVVVLIDEIDKADPDVPNNLLEALGSLQFTVHETGTVVQAGSAPLVIITTNNERELPAAFQRRCVVAQLREHRPDELVEIATYHYRTFAQPVGSTILRQDVYKAVATRLSDLQREATNEGQREPSTAEYLDAVRAACRSTSTPILAAMSGRPSSG
jgi:MoxR-like ATPase